MSRTQRTTTILAVALIAIGLLLGLLPKDWIEQTFGIEPDAGSGVLELGLALAPIAVGIVLLVTVLLKRRRQVRRTG
jgi:preprotein translocase subunit SecG